MKYLVTIYHPDDYGASSEDDALARDIDALNDEMVATGVRIFVGGQHPASRAKSVGTQPNREVLITEGSYLETKAHVGNGCYLDETLTWGRKASFACRVPVEVRPFH